MRVYHSKIFTEDAEKTAKEIMRWRNSKFEYNNRDKESESRWIGIMGEFTMKSWFDSSPWALDYKHNFKVTERDKTDFEFKRCKIDVKAQGKMKPPTDFDFLYVYETQYDRMLNNNFTNTLVFAFYEYPTKECHIVGCVTADDFKKHCVFYEKGKPRTENGLYPLSTNDYAIDIKYALHKNILRPLMDLDRIH